METQTKSWMAKPFFFFFYLLITAVFVSLGPIIFSSSWISSNDFHTCIEISSSLIAIIAAILILSYFFSTKNRYFLIIALGFFVCGSEDLVRGIIGFKYFFAGSGVDFLKFFPGTYAAGRISLTILIIIAVLVEKKLWKVEHVKQEAIFFSVLALLVGGAATALAMNLSLPSFIFPDNLISRPVDFISALLFVIAFSLVLRRYLKYGDIFSGMLGASVLIIVLGQVYMSFSKQLFDLFFDVAHFANILGYCMLVLGISIESFNKIQKSNNEICELRVTKRHLEVVNREFVQIFSATSPLVGIDTNFNIIHANTAFCDLFHCSIENVQKKKCYDIMDFDLCRTDECLLKRAITSEDSLTIERPVHGGENITHVCARQFKNSDNTVMGIVETFNDITDVKKVEQNLQDEQWVKQGLAKLNISMQGEQTLPDLCRTIITFLAEYMSAKIGACFLMQESDRLKLFSSYAYTKRKQISGEFALGQGIIGQAALEREIITLTDIPKDYITISSSLGEILPKNILIMPFELNEKLMGVLEFGFLNDIGTINMDFAKKASDLVAVTINSARNRYQIKEMLKQSQAQTEALQVREEELRHANDTLEKQSSELKKSEKYLQQQQEELRQTNEELEEQTQKLEAQKISVDKKNDQLKEAHEILEEKAKDLEIISKYKSEFLANMSHELRTPLNSILLLSKHLSENKKNNLSKKEIEFADTVHNSGQDLLKLINDILDLSKVEAGKLIMNAEDITLKSVCTKLKTKFLPLAKDKKIDFTLKCTDGLPKNIQTDSQRLEQILNNFISNAIKFTDKGSVSLDIHCPDSDVIFSNTNLKKDNCIAFSVIDTGVGIKGEQQKIIFEAFRQEDGSTSRKYGGTGLGLSISRSIASALGGEIQLISKKGDGSRFILYLPFIFKEPEPLNPYKGSAERSTGSNIESGGMSEKVENSNNDYMQNDYVHDDRKDITHEDNTILIIEDDLNFAKILRDHAREKNYKVLVAETGEIGLHLVDYYKPSGIVLDITLPGMDGWAVISRLKENLDTRHIPVHVISGIDQALEAIKSGAVGHITKPVNMESLDQAFCKIEDVISKKVKNVLIIEGNQAQQAIDKKLIGDDDVDIAIASTGAEAIKLFKRQEFDCVILDLNLPDMSGFEILEKIKKDQGAPTPVIIHTATKLSSKEKAILDKYSKSIVLKNIKSEAKLFDEITLFLHKVQADLPVNKQKILRKIHDKETIFKGKKILLVDDDMRNIYTLKNILEEKGIKIVVAKNGKESLERLNDETDVNLVLMDIMMPEMDGFEATGRIRQQSKFKDLPVIALTAKAMKGDRNRCIEAGASDYLSKPVDMDKLFSMLRVWLY
jgi:PAS domain S-box-containing protein